MSAGRDRLRSRRGFLVLSVSGLLLAANGCRVESDTPATPATTGGAGATATPESSETKTILIDGSSTVFPISQAVAEEFQKSHADVLVSVGTSGTGGGFKKFILGETAINDSSRPIKQSEIDECAKNGIKYLELPVAIDGLSVVVHPENTWCTCLTAAQLKKLWEPESQVKKWKDLDPSWPDEEIHLYGADTESGTFDYFTEAICGKSGDSRSDYTPSTDDNVLVSGIGGDKHSLGYFGYSYYLENKARVKIVAIAEKEGGECVIPSAETVEQGTYTPLSRPLFLHVNQRELKKPEVVDFLRYYLAAEGQQLVEDVGYIRMNPATLESSRALLEEAIKVAQAP